MFINDGILWDRDAQQQATYHRYDWVALYPGTDTTVDGTYPGPRPSQKFLYPNLASSSSSSKKSSSIPDPRTMDIVYTWVNGSNIVHAYKRMCIKEKFTEAIDTVKKAYRSTDTAMTSVAATTRDRDASEMRFSLRSIEKYMKWNEGQISIVSPQVADWVDRRTSRLRFIHQDALIPHAENRHTGNTNGIEIYLHRIPFLSDIFFQFNDDYFLLRETEPDDLYDTKRNEMVLLMERGIMKPDVEKIGEGKGIWASQLHRSSQFLTGVYGRSSSRLFLKHAPYTYCRSMNAAVLQKWKHLFSKLPAARHAMDLVLPYLHHYGMMEGPDMLLKELKQDKNWVNDLDGWWPTRGEGSDMIAVKHSPWPGCPTAQARTGEAGRAKYAKYSGNQTLDSKIWDEFQLGMQGTGKFKFMNINDGYQPSKSPLIEPPEKLKEHLLKYYPKRSQFESPVAALRDAERDDSSAHVKMSPLTSLSEFDLAFIVVGGRFAPSAKQVKAKKEAKEQTKKRSQDVADEIEQSSACAAVCAAVRSATEYGLTGWEKGNIYIGGDLSVLSHCTKCDGGMRLQPLSTRVKKLFSFELQLGTTVHYVPVDTSLLKTVQNKLDADKKTCKVFSCRSFKSGPHVLDETLLLSPSPADRWISRDGAKANALSEGYKNIYDSLIEQIAKTRSSSSSTNSRSLIVLDAVNPVFGEAVMHRHLEPYTKTDDTTTKTPTTYRVKVSRRERGGVLPLILSGLDEYLLTWPLPSPTSRFERIHVSAFDVDSNIDVEDEIELAESENGDEADDDEAGAGKEKAAKGSEKSSVGTLKNNNKKNKKKRG